MDPRGDNWHQFVFYDNKWLNCLLSLADASHEFQIHVFVRILTITISRWAHKKFCSYRKIPICSLSMWIYYFNHHDYDEMNKNQKEQVLKPAVLSHFAKIWLCLWVFSKTQGLGLVRVRETLTTEKCHKHDLFTPDSRLWMYQMLSYWSLHVHGLYMYETWNNWTWNRWNLSTFKNKQKSLAVENHVMLLNKFMLYI